MNESAKQINPSLQKKSAARTAAVQCLYMAAITGETSAPSHHVTVLKKQLSDNRDEQKLRAGVPLEPNYALLETLLSGVESERGEIDTRIDGCLSGEWKRERMSPLLIAILQCAVFEMCFGKEIAPKIIIDEYTRLTRSFFADTEVNFVHGALNKIAQQYG